MANNLRNMQKFVVVSSNNNPDYLFYLPYVEKAWNKYGWTLCVMVTDDVDTTKLDYRNLDTHIYKLPLVDGVNQCSIAQAGRLYAANHLPEDAIIMTSDMDLLPLQDYWHPKPLEITVFGHDLTWFTFYPMGYIAMIGAQWKIKMGLTGDTKADLERDAEEYKHMAKGLKWEEYWDWDWTMITARLKPFAEHITFVNRGQVNIAGGTLAKGRVDRYNWEATLNENTELIDAHCENNNVTHPDKLNKFVSLFEKFYGKL